jgi:hypothetical protein
MVSIKPHDLVCQILITTFAPSSSRPSVSAPVGCTEIGEEISAVGDSHVVVDSAGFSVTPLAAAGGGVVIDESDTAVDCLDVSGQGCKTFDGLDSSFDFIVMADAGVSVANETNSKANTSTVVFIILVVFMYGKSTLLPRCQPRTVPSFYRNSLPKTLNTNFLHRIPKSTHYLQ